MTESRSLAMSLSRAEVAHLTDLIEQFTQLVTDSGAADPAVARLTPDAYPGDEDASAQFRRHTQSELLGRRAADAALVLETLRVDGESFGIPELNEETAMDHVALVLSPEQTAAWLRTLGAVRLVLASRLGIVDDDTALDAGNPLTGVYEWLGFRLDGLVQALDD
jgi:hypothetical protein